MSAIHGLTAFIEREGEWCVALCPEEVKERLHTEVYITPIEVRFG